MPRISKRVQKVKPSPTLAADARAKEMLACGEDVINLGAGEPDFDSPDVVKEAGIEAIRNGVTKYGPVAGLPALRQAVADHLQAEQGLAYQKDQVLISCGAKHSLANFFHAVLDDGDEVVVPAPYWVSYPAQILLAGGTPVFVPSDYQSDFVPDPKAIEAAVTDKTTVLILNSPQNPSGAGYPREVVEEVVRIAIENDLILLSDEIYRKLVYDGFQPVSPAEISGAAKDRTMIINGVSKAWAMTGWRIGWAVGPRDVIQAMTTIQSQGTSGPPGISQHAAIAALGAPESVVTEMVQVFAERMELVVDGLNAIPDVVCPRPRGAFYVFPHVGAYLGRKTPGGKTLKTSVDLQEYLLEDAKVCVVAGDPFGGPGHLRLSFAASTASLKKAIARLGSSLGKLRN